jgi:ribosomal protein S18 acetylase RimI-like enzyme
VSFIEVVDFGIEHAQAAAELFAREYRAVRARRPSLPSLTEDARASTAAFGSAIGGGPGVAAVRDGRLVGFQLSVLDLGESAENRAWPSRASLGGPKTAGIALTRHCAAQEWRREIYRAMYARLAGRVVEIGCMLHSIVINADDRRTLDCWFELGFGVDQIRGVRDTRLIDAVAEVEVRLAEPDDVDQLVDLAAELLEFHATSPMFLPALIDRAAARRSFELTLDDERNGIFVAVTGGALLGMMQLNGGGRPNIDSGRPVDGVNIGMACISASARGRGIGTAILAGVMRAAQARGYGHCTVEWTSANLTSDAFWRRRGFEPLHYTLARHLDERITGV